MNRSIVLIPHYNNPEGLVTSILSLVENQDVLIVDDGSKVKFNENIVTSSFHGGGEIFFKYLKVNEGIEKALNLGLQKILKKSTYQYIARLDCGDVNVNNRIKKQEEYLDLHKDTYLVGSYVDFISKENKFLFRVSPPILHSEIRKKMYLNCMFIHPSVMFRASVLEKVGFYPENYKATEDYAFFFNILLNYQTANIPEVLIRVEANPEGISSKQRKLQVLNRIKIIKDNFYFGYYPIYGILRNIILLFLPYSLINTLKKIIGNA